MEDSQEPTNPSNAGSPTVSAQRLLLIKENIEEEMAKLDKQAYWCRKRAFITHTLTIVLSALITVLAGLRILGECPYAPDAVLICSALLTGITTWGAFLSPRVTEAAINNAYYDLKALKRDIKDQELRSDFPARQDALVDEYHERFQRILARYNEEWQRIRVKPA